MDRIGVVGISWRQRGPEALAAFTIPVEERAERLPRMAREIGTAELVYLATCNRVEVAFVGDGATPVAAYRPRVFGALAGRAAQLGEAEHTFRAWAGEGAAEHLFVVAAGLDSARVGETEIAGQVRDALELSRALGLAGPRLERLFEEALRVARRVRQVTDGTVGRASLAEIALHHLLERLRRTPGRVALVGVSPMTVRCARALAAVGAPLLIVNRTLARAKALAAEVGAQSRSLEDFRRAPDEIEALVLATNSPEPVLRRADLERIAGRTPSGESPLVIDLAIPPDVTPEDAAAADVPRVGLDAITAEAAASRESQLLELADARALVDEALVALRRRSADRLVGPLIAELRRRYRQTALEGVERLFAKELAGLGETEREAIRRWTETLARRFAHVPSVGLRALAFEAGPAALEAFFAGADPRLARELRDLAERAGAPAERDEETLLW